MDKKKIVHEIQTYLADELARLFPLLEQGNVDQETSARIRDIERQLTMYKFLPIRNYGEEDVICPSSLVELEFRGRHAFYFVVPSGGGLVMKVDEAPVQVITPMSPLGEALLGHRVGETIHVQGQGAAREYRIVSMC